MLLASDSLPDDPETLLAIIADIQAAKIGEHKEPDSERERRDRETARLRAEVEADNAEFYRQSRRIEKLKARLAVLRLGVFGRSSEETESAIEQLELTLEDLEIGQAEHEARLESLGLPSPGRKKTKDTPKRKPWPAHL